MPSPFFLLVRALALLCLLLAGGCQEGARPVGTTVLQASGGVTFEGKAFAAGATLPAGRVRIVEGAACVLAPLPGLFLRLTGPAELSLDEAVLGKDNDVLVLRRFRATLLAGRAQVRLEEPGAPAFDAAVRTPAGPVRLRRGTLAEISATGAESAEMLCADGVLFAEPAIEAVEGTWSAGTVATGFAPPQAAADDEARWRRILELREAEELFVRLGERQRLLRP